MSLVGLGIDLVERGLVPEAIVRRAIRQLCAQRLRACDRGSAAANDEALRQFVAATRSGPIAPVPEQANAQHYEVPAAFFAAVLGPHRKYSCGYWPSPDTTLAESEAAALAVPSYVFVLVAAVTVLVAHWYGTSVSVVPWKSRAGASPEPGVETRLAPENDTAARTRAVGSSPDA